MNSLKIDSQSHFSLGSSVILTSSPGESSQSSLLLWFMQAPLSFTLAKLETKIIIVHRIYTAAKSQFAGSY